MKSNLEKLKELSNYLSETESSLSVFWIMNPALLCVTKNGKFTKVNPACLKILGYSQEELLGREYIDFVHKDDLLPTYEIERNLSAGISCFSFTNRYKHKNGSWVYLSWSAKNDSYSNQIYAVATDTTKENSKNQKLISALENAPFGIFLTDKEGKCIYVNNKWKSVTGLTDEEAMGDGWIQGIADSERERLAGIWSNYSSRIDKTKDVTFMCETKYKNIYTGKETPVQIMSYTYGDSEFVGYVDFCLCFKNENTENIFKYNGE